MPVQPPEPPRRAPSNRRFPEVDRDDGMVRARIATRWIAIGGLAGVGVFAGLAAVSTHRAAAKTDQTPAAEQPETTQEPAATEGNHAGDDEETPTTAPAATDPATTPTTTPRATTPRATTPATAPRVTTPRTTPSTLAPAVQTPVQAPSRRHPAVVSGGS